MTNYSSTLVIVSKKTHVWCVVTRTVKQCRIRYNGVYTLNTGCRRKRRNDSRMTQELYTGTYV